MGDGTMRETGSRVGQGAMEDAWPRRSATVAFRNPAFPNPVNPVILKILSSLPHSPLSAPTCSDAHCHYHDARLAPHRGVFAALPVRAAVVCGTTEDDWPEVAAFCREHAWAVPSFGLHPWFVGRRTPRWRERLAAILDEHPRAAVGEVGVDRWIEGHELPDQLAVLREEWLLAGEKDRPVTVHCLRAWGALRDFAREAPALPRGFLLHAYGGPLEMTGEWIERGAYFSFPPYFLHERKAAQREVFARLPLDRLLVETDAPSLWPPPERNPRPISNDRGEPANHPANLDVALAGLAEVRGMPADELAAATNENFARLFGAPPADQAGASVK